MTHSTKTSFRRVAVYQVGRDNKYGQTKTGIGVMKQVTDAMRAGHTVSMREYVEDGVKYMDAEIEWDNL